MQLTIYLPDTTTQALAYRARRENSTQTGWIMKQIREAPALNPATTPHLVQRFQTYYPGTKEPPTDLVLHTAHALNLHTTIVAYLDRWRKSLVPFVASTTPSRRRALETLLIILLE